MNEFESKVLNFIKSKEMIKPSSTVVVGMSGGADSTALLTVLHSLKQVLGIKLVAVHVNHGIRQDAQNDADFSEDYCKNLGIECVVVKKDIPKLSKTQVIVCRDTPN